MVSRVRKQTQLSLLGGASIQARTLIKQEMVPSLLLLSAHTDLEENKRERMEGLGKVQALKKLTHGSLSLLARGKVNKRVI